MVPRLARAPPTHCPPTRLGPLAPTERRDRLRTAQQRQRGRMFQPRRGARCTLAEVPRRMDAGTFLLPSPLLLAKNLPGGCTGEARTRNTRNADDVWHAVGDRHADDAFARPHVVRAAAGGGARCSNARTGGSACRAYSVGR